jgi:hypothetical protein
MKIEIFNKYAIEVRDTKFNYYYAELLQDTSTKNHLNLQKELTRRMKVDHIF